MKSVLTFTFLLVATVNNCYADLIGVSWLGKVYRIDEATGDAVLVNNSVPFGMNSLARDSVGRLFTVSGTVSQRFDDRLQMIDPSNGDLLTSQPILVEDFRALAFSPSDQLFAIRHIDRPFPQQGLNELLTIDVPTGGVSHLGFLELGIQAMEFSRSGILYGWDVGASGRGDGYGLVTVAVDGSGYTDVSPTIGTPGPDIQSIAFGPDGVLYGAKDQLFTINVTTGEWTPVTNQEFDWDIRGIAYIPEPASVAILAFGALYGLKRSFLHPRRR